MSFSHTDRCTGRPIGRLMGETIAASGADIAFLGSLYATSRDWWRWTTGLASLSSLRVGRLAIVVVLSSAIGLSGGCAELDKLSQEQIGTGLGALAGGVGGALVGTQFGSGTGQLIATVVGAVGGAWVGNRIGSYLDERDRKRAAEAAQQATVTGQPQVWRNPDSGVSGRAEVVKTKTTQQKVSVPVLKDRVQQVPPLDLIGEPYRAKADGKVHGGPGADYATVGHLSKGETVTVAAKVKGEPWYMISQGGAGSGFVSASLLTRAPTAVAAKEPEAPSGAVEKRTVEAERTCRTVKQTVTLADKSTREEEVTACQGPNGWEVS